MRERRGAEVSILNAFRSIENRGEEGEISLYT